MIRPILALFLLVFFTPACAIASPEPGTPSFTYQDAIAFMKEATSACIFAVAADGTRGSLHELSNEARRQFVSFVSDPDNFGHPLGMPICPPEVGLEFQKGERKLTLYTTWDFGYFYDHFDKPGDSQGMNFLAVLTGKEGDLAQKWEQKYFPPPINLPHPVLPHPASGN